MPVLRFRYPRVLTAKIVRVWALYPFPNHDTPWSQTFKEKARRHKEEDREDPVRARFPSSTLLPFVFGGLLVKAECWEKGYSYH